MDHGKKCEHTYNVTNPLMHCSVAHSVYHNALK